MRASGAAVLAAAALSISACSRGAIDVQVEARGDQAFELVYSGLYGKESLDLGPTEPTRARDWTIETAGVALVSDAGRDSLRPGRDGQTLPPAIAIRVAARPLSDAMQSVTQLGAEGGLVATRIIRPYTNEKPTGRLSFVARKGASVAAYGAAAPAIADWKGRAVDGLVFIGPAASASNTGATITFASATPLWIQKEAAALVAKLEPALDAAAGKRRGGAPDIFIAVAEPEARDGGADAGGNAESDGGTSGAGLAYAATQTADQIVIELAGAGWRDAAPDAAELLWRALSSQSARQRLAVMKAHPPAWLAEGAADALADEALVAAKVWSADDAARALAKAHAACAGLLGARPLSEAAKDGAAARPCGHAFARAAAGDKGAAALWRDFDKAAKASGKTGFDQFLIVATKHAGPHEAALMRTLMKSDGPGAADTLAALGRAENR